MISAIATPALADDIGVRVGPLGAGVTTGDHHERDPDNSDEREPRDRTTVIKKEDELSTLTLAG